MPPSDIKKLVLIDTFNKSSIGPNPLKIKHKINGSLFALFSATSAARYNIIFNDTHGPPLKPFYVGSDLESALEEAGYNRSFYEVDRDAQQYIEKLKNDHMTLNEFSTKMSKEFRQRGLSPAESKAFYNKLGIRIQEGKFVVFADGRPNDELLNDTAKLEKWLENPDKRAVKDFQNYLGRLAGIPPKKIPIDNQSYFRIHRLYMDTELAEFILDNSEGQLFSVVYGALHSGLHKKRGLNEY